MPRSKTEKIAGAQRSDARVHSNLEQIKKPKDLSAGDTWEQGGARGTEDVSDTHALLRMMADEGNRNSAHEMIS